MHYRHSYHAGNFADVFKHVVLCGLLAALNRKDKPWCYLETHAGAGAYDLADQLTFGAGVTVVTENEDECVLCGLCLDASPEGAVTVTKLYDGTILER